MAGRGFVSITTLLPACRIMGGCKNCIGKRVRPVAELLSIAIGKSCGHVCCVSVASVCAGPVTSRSVTRTPSHAPSSDTKITYELLLLTTK